MSEDVIPYFIESSISGWDSDDRTTWLASRVKQRSYVDDVLTRIDALRSRFDVEQYGQVEYQGVVYPLFAVRRARWRFWMNRPNATPAQ